LKWSSKLQVKSKSSLILPTDTLALAKGFELQGTGWP
jgi:hypothetical protein